MNMADHGPNLPDITSNTGTREDRNQDPGTIVGILNQQGHPDTDFNSLPKFEKLTVDKTRQCDHQCMHNGQDMQNNIPDFEELLP